MIKMALEHLENLLNYYREIQSIIQNPKALLDGREIMDILKIPPSKKVGIILLELKEAQLAGEITTKEQAIDFIQKQSR